MHAKPEDLFGVPQKEAGSDPLPEKKRAPLRIAAIDGELTDEQRAWVSAYASEESRRWLPDGRFSPRGLRK